MPKLRIGIVGCGAIGGSLVKSIIKDFSKQAKLSALFDLDNLKVKVLVEKLHKGSWIPRISRGMTAFTLDDMICRSDLVIEAASAKSSFDIAKAVLASGKDIMVMSVGGVVRDFDILSKLANKNNCRVYIPSGAISGVDALKAASVGKIKSVTLTTTKNPLAFKAVQYILDKGINLDKINKETLLFSGTAKEAVEYFPQNINVAAVLSLAGIGANKTRVRVIASPKVTKNIHEIRIESSAANILTRTENILHPDNPKTSYLAVLSAIATLRQILESIKVGT